MSSNTEIGHSCYTSQCFSWLRVKALSPYIKHFLIPLQKKIEKERKREREKEGRKDYKECMQRERAGPGEETVSGLALAPFWQPGGGGRYSDFLEQRTVGTRQGCV